MKKFMTFMALTSTLLSLPEVKAQVLYENNGVSVTAKDVAAYIDTNLPSNVRENFFQQPGSLKKIIESIYSVRYGARLAETQWSKSEAKELARWGADYAQDRSLLASYINWRVEEALQAIDWKPLAKEVYLAEKERFTEQEQLKVSHILIKPEGRTEEETLELVAEIIDRAGSGEDFGKLASELSEGPSGKRSKGELGYFSRGKMVPEFEQAAFKIEKVGDLVGPVKTKFGYHIIKLLDRKPEIQRPFEEAFPVIKGELMAARRKSEGTRISNEIKNVSKGKVDHEAMIQLHKAYGVPLVNGLGAGAPVSK